MFPSMQIHVHWENFMKNQSCQNFKDFKFLTKGLQGEYCLFSFTIWLAFYTH
jgi:hypothetical protein